MNKKFLFTLSLLGAFPPAWSQDCGGMPAANGVCIPPDSPTSPLYSTYGDWSSERYVIRQSHWRLTWGAIASDKNSGDIGVIVGKFSAREAKHEAMQRCAQHGANSCKIDLAYQNQCAVIAWPSQDDKLVGGVVVTRGGPTIEDAAQGALATCSAAREGAKCKIVYSDCTKPVLEQ